MPLGPMEERLSRWLGHAADLFNHPQRRYLVGATARRAASSETIRPMLRRHATSAVKFGLQIGNRALPQVAADIRRFPQLELFLQGRQRVPAATANRRQGQTRNHKAVSTHGQCRQMWFHRAIPRKGTNGQR